MPLACYEHAPWASLMDEFIRYTAVLPANQVGTRCACDRVGGHLHLHVSVAGTRAVPPSGEEDRGFALPRQVVDRRTTDESPQAPFFTNTCVRPTHNTDRYKTADFPKSCCFADTANRLTHNIKLTTDFLRYQDG